MARNKGLLNISANFEPQIAAPFDARDKIATKADLTLTATWTANDGSPYIYKGLKTVVTDDADPLNNGLWVLKGDDYTQIASWEQAGSGTNGADGKSAYQIAVDAGFVGTEAEWLASLHGVDGADGSDGTNGTNGASAYEVWLGLGNTGTEQDFIDSLKGLNGTIDNAIALNTGVWTDSGKRRRGKMVEWVLIEAGALPNNTTKYVAIPGFNSTLYDYFVDAAESVAFNTGNYSLGLSYNGTASSFIKYHVDYSTGSVILGAIGTDYSIYDNTELVVRRITK